MEKWKRYMFKCYWEHTIYRTYTWTRIKLKIVAPIDLREYFPWRRNRDTRMEKNVISWRKRVNESKMQQRTFGWNVYTNLSLIRQKGSVICVLYIGSLECFFTFPIVSGFRIEYSSDIRSKWKKKVKDFSGNEIKMKKCPSNTF